MKIIDFEKVKARKHSRNVNNFPYADNGESELQEQYVTRHFVIDRNSLLFSTG